MIQVYTDPWLIDFLIVCNRMSQDQREQIEALSGAPYNAEQAAIGHFTVPGPKWVIKADDKPIVVAGFTPERPGVWRDFLLSTPEAWTEHWFAVTRICRRVMDGILLSKDAHRLECISTVARERTFRWNTVLGYNREGTLHGYCANGADAVIFSRVQH